jgi:hypothetical protein
MPQTNIDLVTIYDKADLIAVTSLNIDDLHVTEGKKISKADLITDLGIEGTDLTDSRNDNSVTIISSTGTSTTIPQVTNAAAGVMTAVDKVKLDGIEAGASADQTGADFKAGLETLVGAGRLNASAIEGLNYFSGNYNDLTNQPNLAAFDNVDEFANLAAFPATGLVDRFYIAQDTGNVFRWNGSSYSQTNGALALGETALTAYRGDRGVIAYDHSQLTSTNVISSEVDLTGYTTPATTSALTATDNVSEALGKLERGVIDVFSIGGEQNVQSDWNENNTGLDAHILNRPTTITQSQSEAITANTAKVTAHLLIDDDTLATATPTNVASAESIKAYVDGAKVNLQGNNLTGTGAFLNETNTIDLNDDQFILNPDQGSNVGFVSLRLQDDDTMTAASATEIASSESIKAYVDSTLPTILTVQATPSFTNVPAGDKQSQNVTVTGAVPGDVVTLGIGANIVNLMFSHAIVTNDIVQIHCINYSLAGTASASSVPITIKVFK